MDSLVALGGAIGYTDIVTGNDPKFGALAISLVIGYYILRIYETFNR